MAFTRHRKAEKQERDQKAGRARTHGCAGRGCAGPYRTGPRIPREGVADPRARKNASGRLQRPRCENLVAQAFAESLEIKVPERGWRICNCEMVNRTGLRQDSLAGRLRRGRAGAQSLDLAQTERRDPPTFRQGGDSDGRPGRCVQTKPRQRIPPANESNIPAEVRGVPVDTLSPLVLVCSGLVHGHADTLIPGQSELRSRLRGVGDRHEHAGSPSERPRASPPPQRMSRKPSRSDPLSAGVKRALAPATIEVTSLHEKSINGRLRSTTSRHTVRAPAPEHMAPACDGPAVDANGAMGEWGVPFERSAFTSIPAGASSAAAPTTVVTPTKTTELPAGSTGWESTVPPEAVTVFMSGSSRELPGIAEPPLHPRPTRTPSIHRPPASTISSCRDANRDGVARGGEQSRTAKNAGRRRRRATSASSSASRG
jgi:hypothetical protein